MHDQFHTESINHISVHFMPTTKYKTNFISVYLRQPLREETHTQAALLPFVLKRGTMLHPTAKSIERALNDLYGATLTTDVYKRGEEQVMVFRLQLANEKFLRDKEPLFEKGIRLLSEILSQPRLEDGIFYQRHVELEKDLLSRRLSQIKDDKIRYASKRCVEEMFKDEPYRLFAYGSPEQIPHITAESLYTYFQEVIRHYPIDLFVVGDLPQEKVRELVAQSFNWSRRPKEKTWVTSPGHHVRKVRQVVEKTKIAQGKLNIGCRTWTVYKDDDYVPLLVFNGLFGGFSHSKLFRHVREKESLAYYISSSIESHKGFMMIMSGIDFNNFAKTVDIIQDQLKQVQRGEMTDEELDQTKALLINQIKEDNDQPFHLMERFYHGIIGGMNRNGSQLIEAITRVSKDDVVRVAEKIELDTIYFLTSEEAGDKHGSHDPHL